MIKRILCLVALSCMMLVAPACNKGESDFKLVDDFLMKAETQEGDVVLTLKGLFNFERVMMPSVTIPIFNPHNPEEPYGEMRLAPTFDGRSEISVTLNLNNCFQVPTGDATLPNGDLLPVGGLDGAEIVSIPFEEYNAKVYLAADGRVKLVGFAISIKELDELGASIGGTDIFPRFAIGNFRGVAGLYSSPNGEGTGIALFADLSNVLPSSVLEAAKFDDQVESQQFREAFFNFGHDLRFGRVEKSQAIFESRVPSRRHGRKVFRHMKRAMKKLKDQTVQLK